MLHGRLLRYLDEVARVGSIRKAARGLNVASSAINRHIIEIEEELGAPIFERLPRGLRLTATGEVLIAHVRETLRAHERAIAQIQALKGLSRGEVTIATMASLASGLVADAAVAFRRSHPDIRLNVEVMNRPELVAAVIAGEVDIAVAYNLPIDPRLQRAGEFVHRLGAVVAPDHPLAQHAIVRLADCLSYPLVVARSGLSLRDVVESLIPATAEMAMAVETNSVEMMKRLAREAPHITFLNRADVDQDVRDGALRFLVLQGNAGRQILSVVHRARGSITPAASMFLQFLEARLRTAESLD
jgi:DNA-binding transcriptional LysR family regulator